jgi:hypothetical protein
MALSLKQYSNIIFNQSNHVFYWIRLLVVKIVRYPILMFLIICIYFLIVTVWIFLKLLENYMNINFRIYKINGGY